MVTLRSGSSTSQNKGGNTTKGEKEMINNGSFRPMKYFTKADTKCVSTKWIQLVTFISLVIDLLGFTVILPLFPSLLEYYSRHDSSGLYFVLHRGVSNLGTFLSVPQRFNSILFGGMLGSMFSFLQFLSSPIFGALSDVYGRKPIFLLSLIGIAASYGLWVLASNFVIFVLARVIGGLFKGNVSLSYSVMTDILDASNRSKGMALIGVAFSIGFIVGPIVGVGFAKWGSSGWFAASASYALSLSLLNIIFVFLFFSETLPPEKRRNSLQTGMSEASIFINPFQLFAFKPAGNLLEKKERINLSYLGCIYFLYIFIYSGLEFTITFVTHYYHGFTSMDQGKMFTYLGLVMAIVQGGFSRNIKAGQEKITAIVGLSIMAPAFIVVGMSSSRMMLYVGLTLYSIGSSLIVTCLTALASKYGSVSDKGTILGIWRSLGALARASGPLIACLGFWLLGCSAAYTIGGLGLAIPLIMLLKY